MDRRLASMKMERSLTEEDGSRRTFATDYVLIIVRAQLFRQNSVIGQDVAIAMSPALGGIATAYQLERATPGDDVVAIDADLYGAPIFPIAVPATRPGLLATGGGVDKIDAIITGRHAEIGLYNIQKAFMQSPSEYLWSGRDDIRWHDGECSSFGGQPTCL